MMVHDRDIRLALSIVRERIIERISSAAQQRITLIHAPAGYGKSVALRHFLETLQKPFVRYDVRAEHGTLLGFVRGFADALLEVAPDARKTVAGAEERSRSSKTPGIDLAMWMHAHLESFSGVIAIDDLHLTEGDAAISAFLASLIERTKGSVQWVLASRSTLDLPIGSWLAYGDMDLPIDEHDLRFTVEEAQQAAMGASELSEAEVREIVAMTEGWPAAIGFALRTSARSADLRSIASGTRELAYRYLAEQVYRALCDDERDLLHFVGLLPEITVDLVRRDGCSDARAALESLCDRIAFIYRDGSVYRCHDLFRDFLQFELEMRGDRAVETMQRRVAAALEDSGDLPQALVHYARGGCTEQALRLLESHGFALMEQAHADAVQIGLESLPEATRSSNASVLGLRGLQEANAGRFDRAESLLQRAIDLSDSDALKAPLAMRLALVLLNQQRDATPLLEPLRDAALPVAMRGEVLSLLAVAYTNVERSNDARALFNEVEQLLAKIDDDAARAKILQRVGARGAAVGLSLLGMSERLSAAADIAVKVGLFSLASRAYCTLSNMAIFHEDDVARSLAFASLGADTALKAGDRLGAQTALLQLMLGEVRQGRADEVRALEKRFFAASTTDTIRMAYVQPIRAALASWDGRFAEAHRLLGNCIDRIGTPWERTYHQAECALYLIGAEEDQTAKEYVEKVAEALSASAIPELMFLKRQRILSGMLCAIAEALAGRSVNAHRFVRAVNDRGSVATVLADSVFALSRAKGRAHFLDDVQRQMRSLSALGYGGLAKTIAGVAQKRIVSMLGDPLLTVAEVKVLLALDKGLAPKDIAARTSRSVYTVQAHIHNIIRKLGCSGRAEALAVARRRGLLN